MNYPLQTLIQMGVVPPVVFPTDSRYYGSGIQQYALANGQSVAYLQRRIVPQPGAPNYATIAQHTVRQGDRLDLIAAKYLGDPLIFWLHLRRQRSNSSRRSCRYTGQSAGHHHAARRAGSHRCLRAFNSR